MAVLDLPHFIMYFTYKGVIFRKWSPVPKCPSVLPTLSSIWFSLAVFMLTSLIHLDLSFVHGDRYASIFILLHVDIQLRQHHLLNMLFIHLIFFASLSKISSSKVCGLISGSAIQFHWSSCLFLCQPTPGCFKYYSFVVEFKVRDCDASRSSFIVQDCFGYPGFFLFHMKLSTILWKTCMTRTLNI